MVNEWGRSHDVKNLFIIDGSIFVTSAGVNPTRTIQALALYIAEAQFALSVDNHASFDDKGHKHGSGDTGIRYDTGCDLLDAAFRIPREG